MNGTDLPRHAWALWGRPIHPVALGVSILTATLVAYNLADRGVLGAHVLGDVVALLAGAALFNLVVGWATQWRVLVRVGLLAAFACYTLRGVALLLLVGPGAEGVWLSLGGAVICGGSYLLEAWDSDSGR